MQLHVHAILKALSMGLIVAASVKGLAQEAEPPAGKKGSSETEQGATELPEMTVTASPLGSTGYSVSNASTATKTDTPIFDTPLSIQVVPYSVIRDQKSYQLKDSLENVSGVRPNTIAGYAELFVVRGFTQEDMFRNGLQLNFTTLDTATAESIEVLKGPAAVLYGRIEPGGLINLVTKKPLATPYYSFEQRFGSYDFYRTEWDATGPLTKDGSLLYRFVGAYQNNASFRDFHDLERVLLFPSVTWRPSDSTEWTVDLEALLDNTHIDGGGLPAIGTRPAPIPIGRSFQDPNDPGDDINNVRIGSNFTHHLNDTWTLRNRFLYYLDDYSDRSLGFSFPEVRPDDRTLDRLAFLYETHKENYQTNLDLTGKLNILGTAHDTLVGFDFRLFSTDGFFHFKEGAFDVPDPALAIDIFNPRYGVDPAVFDLSNFDSGEPIGDQEEHYGVYFQDHITLWNKLHILGGGRQDWATITSLGGERKDAEFSPRVGLLYQPWRWFGVYGNWAQSFGQSSGVSSSGEPLTPERGEQFEAGLKASVFDERITGTLTFYYLTKQNILTADLTTPENPFDSIAIGEARSQGIELDVAGQLTDHVSLIGSWAYTDAEVIKDNGGLQGKRLPNAPRNAGSLWLKYDVNGYSATGFSFGLGVFAAGQREGDVENSFQLPGYARLDAMAAYLMEIGPTRVTTQFNVRNLLDKEYFENADTGDNNFPRIASYPADPLTVLGSVRVEW